MTLHDYQVRGVQHLWDNPRAGLFLDMGLGKTFTVLAALHDDQLPALVVAPKLVTERTWPAEIAKWRPDLSYAVAAGTPAKRIQALHARADITLISRDNMRDAIGARRYQTVVLDELSSWKDRGTQRWKAAQKITTGVRNVWGLTGTPASNGYMDLWAQMALLDGGQRLGRTLTGFRNRYFTIELVVNGIPVKWALRPGAAEDIKSRISDICLSMTASEIPETHNEIEVPLSPQARKAYNAMASEMLAELGDTPIRADNAAIMAGKLQQITAGFLYDEDHNAHRFPSDKAAVLRRIVDEAQGSPIAVFYWYEEELAILREALPEARLLKDKGVLEAWDRGAVPVMLLHPASAGHGLNLQHGGHIMVWASLPRSTELFSQASKRIARQGQTEHVITHYLKSPGTVDYLIHDTLRGNQSVERGLMDYLRKAV